MRLAYPAPVSGSAAGDGRLDLDELGEVIDHARPLGADPTDDLLEGHDGTTWRERLEAAGVTPWLRRHRGPLAAVAVVVLLAGGAATSWRRSLPPPIDPEIRASARDAVPDGSVQFGADRQDDVVSATVVVTASTPGDLVLVRGLYGPGIRASTATAGAPVGAGRTAEVTVVAGCDDPRALDPPADAYQLRVTRTDGYGRSTDGLLPVPGSIGTGLAQNLGAACVQQLLTESVTAMRVDVRPDYARRVLHLGIALHNASGHDLALSGIGNLGMTLYTSSDPVVLPAGGTTTVTMTAQVLDCAAPRLDGVAVPYLGTAGAYRQVDGVGFYASPVDSVTGSGGQVLVALTPRQAAEVQRALDRMCAGAPGTTVTVLDASRAEPPSGAAFGSGSAENGVSLRLRIEVRSTGSRVALADGSFPPSDVPIADPRQMTAGSADVVRGHAVLTVDWLASCDGGTPPPVAQLAVAVHGRSYPVRALLAQPVLARAYAETCPALTSEDLQSYGWPPPAWRPTP